MKRRRTSDLSASAGPTAAQGAMARLGMLFSRLSLPAQMATTVLASGALLALLAAAVQRWAAPIWAGSTGAAATPDAALLLGVASATLFAALAAGLLARRSARALLALAGTARALRRDEAPAALQLPLPAHSAEWRQASQALHRLVEAQRAQKRALQTRNAQLGQQLQQRTHELSTLQDLSAGLAAADDLYGLVDEALKALEQTLDYSSASIWSRDRRGDAKQVVLTGYRSNELPAGGPGQHTGQPIEPADPPAGAVSSGPARPPQTLLGKRLSRSNLQRYEQIEREREPLIDNNARQSLLSWLWEKVTDDASTSALYRGTRSWMGLPLRFRDEVLGVMRVDHHAPGYFDAERVRLLGAVCSQTALAMHHARLLVQERELAVVAERGRIARDLHDAVSQTLFASNVMAGALAKLAARVPAADPTLLKHQAEALEKLNRGALSEMRMLLFELRPDALDNQPLAELLRHPIEALVCRGDLHLHTEVAAHPGADAALAPAIRIQLYRIAQEALANIARHSGASQASVQWAPDAAGGALLRIHDNGQGFDADLARPGHFGLDNMRSRAAEIGATLVLTTAPGQGTEVRIQLGATGPLAQSAPPAPAAP